MYKCLLFDLDGTLADTDLLIVEGFLHFFRKYKKEKVSLSTLASLSGPSLKDSMKKYFPAYNTDEMVQEFRDFTWPLYETYIEFFEGIKEVLEVLKDNKLKLGIITSKMKEATIKTLEVLGVDNYFDYIVCIEDVNNGKPDPEGINKALEYFNVSKCDTLFVGDAITDLLAANNANVDCCFVSWNLRGRLENVYPKYYVDSHIELKEVIFNGK